MHGAVRVHQTLSPFLFESLPWVIWNPLFKHHLKSPNGVSVVVEISGKKPRSTGPPSNRAEHEQVDSGWVSCYGVTVMWSTPRLNTEASHPASFLPNVGDTSAGGPGGNTQEPWVLPSEDGLWTGNSFQKSGKDTGKDAGDFPSGPEVTNLPCNPRDAGSIPGRRAKIPRALEQQSLWTTTRRLHATSKDPSCDAMETPGGANKTRKTKGKKKKQFTV